MIRNAIFAALVLCAGAASAQTPEPAEKYGHLRYAEAAATDLVDVCIGSSATKLHQSVKPDLDRMVAAAKADGVPLKPMSCFRPIARQKVIFNSKITKKVTPEIRAKVSAPPGYSEHATGYTIDFCSDAEPGSCDLPDKFGDTKVAAWLKANANKFNFEQSFSSGKQCHTDSKGVTRCVHREPWHWRWVGDATSKAVFAEARRRYPATPAVE
jgi:D-alanyl-D-alanine carboxypeptidase